MERGDGEKACSKIVIYWISRLNWILWIACYMAIRWSGGLIL